MVQIKKTCEGGNMKEGINLTGIQPGIC